MSLRIDTTELISGALVIGDTGHGVLGSDIPSVGDNGPSYLYNDLSLPADADKEIRGLIVTPPSAGTLFAYEDGSFFYDGPDGSYTFTYRLYVDGVDTGTSTVYLHVGPYAISGEIAYAAASGYDAGVNLQNDIAATLGTAAASGHAAGADVFASPVSPTAFPARATVHANRATTARANRITAGITSDLH